MAQQIKTLEGFGIDGVNYVNSEGVFSAFITTHKSEIIPEINFKKKIKERVFDNSVVYLDTGEAMYEYDEFFKPSEEITLIAKNFLGYDIKIVADDIMICKKSKKETYGDVKNSVEMWTRFLARCVESVTDVESDVLHLKWKDDGEGKTKVVTINEDMKVLCGEIHSTSFTPTKYASKETLIDTEEDRLNKLLLDSLSEEQKSEMAKKINTLEKHGVDGVKFVDKYGAFNTKIVTPGKNGVRFEEKIMGRTVGDSVIYAKQNEGYYYDILSKPSEEVTLVAKNFMGYDIELSAESITTYDGENKYDVAGASVELWAQFLTKCIESSKNSSFVSPDEVNTINDSLNNVLGGNISYIAFEPIATQKESPQENVSTEQELSLMLDDQQSTISAEQTAVFKK